MKINPDVNDIFKFEFEFLVENYNPPHIKGEVSI